jgi:hypothetical protein
MEHLGDTVVNMQLKIRLILFQNVVIVRPELVWLRTRENGVESLSFPESEGRIDNQSVKQIPKKNTAERGQQITEVHNYYIYYSCSCVCVRGNIQRRATSTTKRSQHFTSQ